MPRKEYEYRVIAINDAGEGEPSSSSVSIPARPEKGYNQEGEAKFSILN